jgi:hypothetical protein
MIHPWDMLKQNNMIIRYLIHIIWVEIILRLLNFFIFPLAYMIKPKSGFLWWFLHDGCWYGDKYFNPKQKETFWIAYRWAMRNPTHNYYYSHTIEGKEENYTGWETCQRDNVKFMWRTPKTKDKNGVFQDKNGKYMSLEFGIYGKQRIRFEINGKKYFRCSGAVPRKLWKNLYWIFAYKFGFESVNWAIQFQPFTFKRLLSGDYFELKKYEYK